MNSAHISSLDTNEIVALFESIGEPFAAGLFMKPEKSLFYRYCMALANWYDASEPATYEGELLYPAGTKFFALSQKSTIIPHYCKTYIVHWERLQKKNSLAHDIMRAFADISAYPAGWYHSAPNYHRILKEGLSSYRTRIEARPAGEEFREGLLLLLASMERYITRSVAYLKEMGAPAKLWKALSKVPFGVPETLYEGLVAWNMIFYFDGCDNLGCLDKGLIHLYKGEDITAELSQLFLNLQANDVWSCTIGPDCNEITKQAIIAIRGKARPLLELMVDDRTTPEVWELAAQNYATGSNANPSFYNAIGIHDMLHQRFPDIPEEELQYFCGCGCTETNLEGYTRAGGTDADMQLTAVFEQYLMENRLTSATFEEFFEGLCRKNEEETHKLLDRITEWYLYMGKYLPNPTRTLFMDDCIDKGLDFNAGGARYTWTMNSDSGLINVIDSLAAIRKLVYEDHTYTPEEFMELLQAEDPSFMTMLKKCPCYGTDDDYVDALGSRYAEQVYGAYLTKKPVGFIDAHTVTEHSFKRYIPQGAKIGPTPDGRHAAEPLCDSIAALRGKAIKGPTAMLRSAAKLPQHMAIGISVLNLTLSKQLCQNLAVIPALIKGYFREGGIQVQLTVTSPDELQDAILHPERHEDLIVRIGGYSEYFNKLTPEIKQSILERNIHEGV